MRAKGSSASSQKAHRKHESMTADRGEQAVCCKVPRRVQKRQHARGAKDERGARASSGKAAVET
jgi:hypothetical protein